MADGNGAPFGDAGWAALTRMLGREDPSYRNHGGTGRVRDQTEQRETCLAS